MSRWNIRYRGLALVVAAVLVGGYAALAQETGSVVVYTSIDQVFAEPVFRILEEKTGLSVRAVFDTEETKSTGVLNRLIAEGANPQADVFWSGDPVRPFLLIERGLVAPYLSPEASAIPREFRDGEGMWTGSAARARVLLVDRSRLGSRPPPRSILDLVSPTWKGETAIANPLFGTTTMHVASLFAAWGDERSRDFLARLTQNEVRIASSNGEVRRLVTGGEITFGLTDTDDAYEAVKSGAPVDVVYPDQEGLGSLVMPTAVLLIRGGPNPAGARRAIDFLLSAEVERQMATSAAHMPLRTDVPAIDGRPALSDLRAMPVSYGKVASEMSRIQPLLREWVGY